MELFKLLGTIAIGGADEAKAKVDGVTNKANELADKLGSAGKKISDFGGKLTTRLSLPLTALGVTAVKSAADVKAMNSQFEQTFAGVEKQATSAMKSVADSSGILQTRLQGIGTSIYAFAKSSGADSAEAMTLMEEALQATADAAAYYDRSLEDTSESLMSFLKGNFANDAALGVSCTETTRNAKAMELFGKKYNDLSEIQKQQTLLKMVTDAQKLSGAMGQASRESDGFENVMGNLKESGKQLAAELGEVLLPTVIKLVQGLTEMLREFSKMDDGTKKLILTIGGIAIAIGPVLTAIGKTVSAVGTIISVFGKVSGSISGIITIGGKLLGGIKAIAGFASGSLIPALAAIPAPVWIIIAVVGALVAAGVALYKNWDEVSAFGKEAWGAITDFIGKAKDKIVGFFQNIIDFISDNWQALLMLIVNPVAGAFKLLYDNCDSFREFFDGFIGKIKDSFTEGLENLKQKAEDFKASVVEKFTNMKDSAVEKLAEMKAGASEAFANLKESVEEKIESMKAGAIEKFNTMKEHVVSKAQEIKNEAAEHFNQLEAKWSEGFTNAKEKIVAIASELKESATAKIQELKESASQKIGEFTQAAVSKFGELKDKGSAAIQTLRDGAVAKFSEMGNAVGEKFTNVANTITSIFTKAKGTLSDIVDTIKGLFSFDFKLPEIKMPEFNITPPGWKISDLLQGVIPKLDIKWNAEGGVLTQPTIFGNIGNTLLGGGEAGAEAIAPIETLKAYIREAVSESNMQFAEVMAAILALLQQYMPELANMQVVLSTGAVVGELAEPLNEELGKLAQMRGRRN